MRIVPCRFNRRHCVPTGAGEFQPRRRGGPRGGANKAPGSRTREVSRRAVVVFRGGREAARAWRNEGGAGGWRCSGTRAHVRDAGGEPAASATGRTRRDARRARPWTANRARGGGGKTPKTQTAPKPTNFKKLPKIIFPTRMVGCNSMKSLRKSKLGMLKLVVFTPGESFSHCFPAIFVAMIPTPRRGSGAHGKPPRGNKREERRGGPIIHRPPFPFARENRHSKAGGRTQSQTGPQTPKPFPRGNSARRTRPKSRGSAGKETAPHPIRAGQANRQREIPTGGKDTGPSGIQNPAIAHPPMPRPGGRVSKKKQGSSETPSNFCISFAFHLHSFHQPGCISFEQPGQ